ncbi:MAG: hypothetical protein MR210_04500 [Erysipelotrichaceae bacterium]|nr:hypothetical protein [Erysipelotrichaceae bacterium]MDY5252622.1 hypothetical protein [Erysipelotrichaceae bacterium]
MRKTILKFIGYFLIPICLCLAGYHYQLNVANFTSIMHFFHVKIVAFLILSFFFYLLSTYDLKYARIFAILTLLVILIPYDLDLIFSSFCHVVLAYIALFIFNYLIFSHLGHREIKIYLIIIGICISLIFKYASITGLCEIIYISCCSIILTKEKASRS